MSDKHWSETILDIDENMTLQEEKISYLETKTRENEHPFVIDENGQLCITISE